MTNDKCYKSFINVSLIYDVGIFLNNLSFEVSASFLFASLFLSQGHHNWISSVALCQASNWYVVTGSRDGAIKVWI